MLTDRDYFYPFVYPSPLLTNPTIWDEYAPNNMVNFQVYTIAQVDSTENATSRGTGFMQPKAKESCNTHECHLKELARKRLEVAKLEQQLGKTNSPLSMRDQSMRDQVNNSFGNIKNNVKSIRTQVTSLKQIYNDIQKQVAELAQSIGGTSSPEIRKSKMVQIEAMKRYIKHLQNQMNKLKMEYIRLIQKGNYKINIPLGGSINNLSFTSNGSGTTIAPGSATLTPIPFNDFGNPQDATHVTQLPKKEKEYHFAGMNLSNIYSNKRNFNIFLLVVAVMFIGVLIMNSMGPSSSSLPSASTSL